MTSLTPQISWAGTWMDQPNGWASRKPTRETSILPITRAVRAMPVEALIARHGWCGSRAKSPHARNCIKRSFLPAVRSERRASGLVSPSLDFMGDIEKERRQFRPGPQIAQNDLGLIARAIGDDPLLQSHRIAGETSAGSFRIPGFSDPVQ